MKNIAILGSTGSIGQQTLDVVRQHPDRFRVVMISANNSSELLISQALEFNVPDVVICNGSKFAEVRDALPGRRVHGGIDAACALPILPVDSEHSAIFQCLQAAQGNSIEKIHLTASGGPFRTWPREQIEVAGKDLALKHPNWNMGAKITIDSATMMNKGFEVIEACWLFGVGPERIHVVVHPESVIHSMVEFVDGAVLAQLGCPDMREPIQLAMSYPDRYPLNNKKLDFSALQGLTFYEPDYGKFPCLGLAFEAMRRGGNIPCAMNAANEAAVAAYLQDRIRFYDIPEIISRVMDGVNFVAEPSLDDIFATHDQALSLV